MIDYMELIKAEVTGIYGDAVLQDLNEIIGLYDIYDGTDPMFTIVDDLDYDPTRKATNFIKKIIKEEARFLFGKTPELIARSEDKSAAEGVQDYLNSVLVQNMFSDKLLKAARDCFIGKRVALKVYNDGKRLRFNFRPSPSFVFEPKDDDIDTLDKIIFYHGLNNKLDKDEQRIWKQKYHMENGKCILDEGIYNGYAQLIEEIHTNLDTGLDFIPAKVILNDGLSDGLQGESDVAELKDLQRAYNQLTSDDIDALKFNMFPQTVATNASGKSLENIIIAPGALVDLQTETTAPDGVEAALAKLEASFNYDTRMENMLARVKSDMYELLNIPNVSPSDLKGYMTSGKSMKALYWQLVTRCEEKFTTWRPALEWLAWSILKMSDEYGIKKLVIPDDLTISVENIYPLMEDEFDEKALDMTAVNTQVMSRKSYIRKWGKDVDNDAADAELQQIQAEKEMLEDNFTGDFGGDA